MPTKKRAARLDREIAEALARPRSNIPKRRHHATKPTKRPAHTTKKKDAQKEIILEMIASTDPKEWSVARDLAIQQDIQDMLVQLDMARVLNVAPSELEVDEEPYGFKVSHGRNQTYIVYPDEDTAYNMAVDREISPEMFETDSGLVYWRTYRG